MLFLLKNWFLVSLILNLIIFSSVASASASASIVEEHFVQRKQAPQAEIIDLILDGSINPVRKNLTKDYDFITKLHFELDYEQTDWIPSDFAASDALENGTATISENGALFDGNFTQNDKVYFAADIAIVVQDDKTPKVTHIYGLINLFEIMPIYGLAYTTIDSLYFIVQDNLTAPAYAIVEFQVLVIGFKWDDTKEASSSPPNPFETLNTWALWFMANWGLWLLVIVALAVFIFIIRKTVF